jgi:voltage-gated potassium channel
MVRRRGSITLFVERHLLAWEGTMAGLAVVYLALGVLTDDSRGPSPIFLGVLGGLFLAEFTVRCWAAPSRRQYAQHHWLDLVSCIPMIGGLRAVRLLRLFRLASLGRTAVFSQHISTRRGSPSVWLVAPVLGVLWFGSASAYWIIEHGSNSNVNNFGDALYWAFITATTVGYGDVGQLSSAGRVLAGVVIFIGIGLVGYASALVTARFVGQPDTNDAVLKEVSALRDDLRLMHDLLATHHRAHEPEVELDRIG